MLDGQNRVTIRKELILKGDLKLGKKAYLYYDDHKKRILVRDTMVNPLGMLYFIKTVMIDEKGRIHIPSSIKKAFPGATYLPVESSGRIYILIIEHEKKPE